MAIYMDLNAFEQAIKDTKMKHQLKLEDSYIKLLTDKEQAQFEFTNDTLAMKQSDFDKVVSQLN